MRIATRRLLAAARSDETRNAEERERARSGDPVGEIKNLILIARVSDTDQT
jgi:hypothetical protein